MYTKDIKLFKQSDPPSINTLKVKQTRHILSLYVNYNLQAHNHLQNQTLLCANMKTKQKYNIWHLKICEG